MSNMFINSLGAVSRFVLRNPSSVAGVTVFGLAFSVVAGNAIYSQSSSHPDPIWQTRDMAVTRSVTVEKKPVSITRTVLTQTISLKNIPVPTMSPSRSNKIATHSSIVRDVQSALAEIGYYNGGIDGIYGSATSTAIMNFQKSAGILPDGEASFGLLSSIKSAKAVALKNGAQIQQVQNAVSEPVPTQQAALNAAIVSKIQRGLNEFGFNEVDVDGIIGSQTRRAISDFQKQFNLDVTGEPGKDILEKLVEIGVLTNT